MISLEDQNGCLLYLKWEMLGISFNTVNKKSILVNLSQMCISYKWNPCHKKYSYCRIASK